MIGRPPRSTLDRSSAASDVYKRQDQDYISLCEPLSSGRSRRPSIAETHPHGARGLHEFVVDGFRHADDVDAHVLELAEDVHRSVAADGDQPVQCSALEIADRLVRHVLDLDAPVRPLHRIVPVSYTHLTLPTSDLV